MPIEKSCLYGTTCSAVEDAAAVEYAQAQAARRGPRIIPTIVTLMVRALEGLRRGKQLQEGGGQVPPLYTPAAVMRSETTPRREPRGHAVGRPGDVAEPRRGAQPAVETGPARQRHTALPAPPHNPGRPRSTGESGGRRPIAPLPPPERCANTNTSLVTPLWLHLSGVRGLALRCTKIPPYRLGKKFATSAHVGPVLLRSPVRRDPVIHSRLPPTLGGTGEKTLSTNVSTRWAGGGGVAGPRGISLHAAPQWTLGFNNEVLRADKGETRWPWSSAGKQGRGKQEIPEKTRLSVASSCTIPVSCENPKKRSRNAGPLKHHQSFKAADTVGPTMSWSRRADTFLRVVLSKHNLSAKCRQIIGPISVLSATVVSMTSDNGFLHGYTAYFWTSCRRRPGILPPSSRRRPRLPTIQLPQAHHLATIQRQQVWHLASIQQPQAWHLAAIQQLQIPKLVC
ncbi:hypothetical protein PR048_032162 [Dryococelus australis]|uniref:Uncharacterized protein n=1 Tax=Dryococelus australis TaxID=614101 RepID=A0ABQ9G1F0_9NEOP|nr:hypothetical protein PR048_032162 [Dryococelus australis]